MFQQGCYYYGHTFVIWRLHYVNAKLWYGASIKVYRTGPKQNKVGGEQRTQELLVNHKDSFKNVFPVLHFIARFSNEESTQIEISSFDNYNGVENFLSTKKSDD